MRWWMGLFYGGGAQVTYASGDSPACLRKSQDLIGYDKFRREQSRARFEGRYIGVGIGAYVEGTGLGPYEGAIVQIESSGKVLVTTGAAPQGQGHVTTMAQIAAHELGIDVNDVTVITGDTGAIPFGIGTFRSEE